jgi:four helix bundle suffix protein
MTTFLQQKGNYKKLLAYQKAECIYDITYYFAHTYLEKGDRTIDQMIQAARSGKQNIAEGSAAATTSSETELKLTNVARASLQELLVDYEDYLRTRNLEQWPANDPRLMQTRQVCAKHTDSAFFMEQIQHRTDATIANILITLIHQEDYLLRKLIDHLQDKFIKSGGIREQMTAARLAYRNRPH